jgi:DnaJ-domain-containing protein 1
MEIPGYGLEPEEELEEELTEFQQSLKLRFEACKQRYRGMEEHMDIPDMDLWLNLKNEIISKLERQVSQTYYTEKEINDEDNDDDDYLSRNKGVEIQIN